MILIIGGMIFSSSTHSKKEDFPKESLINAEKFIAVDVSGAVKTPGVYNLKEGARIEEAIELAGGFNEKANKEYISKYINLAQKLSDGTKIYVPEIGENGITGGPKVAGISSESKVNINNSTQAEIEALPGIGPVTASKIIADRPYQKVEDLLSKKIISKALFEKIKDSLVVY